MKLYIDKINILLDTITKSHFVMIERLTDITNDLRTLSNNFDKQFSMFQTWMQYDLFGGSHVITSDPFELLYSPYFGYHGNVFVGDTVCSYYDSSDRYYCQPGTYSSFSFRTGNSYGMTVPYLAPNIPYLITLQLPASFSSSPVLNFSVDGLTPVIDASSYHFRARETDGHFVSTVQFTCVFDMPARLSDVMFSFAPSFTCPSMGVIGFSVVQSPSVVTDTIKDAFDASDSSALGSSAQDFADQASKSLGVVSYVDTVFSGLSGLVVSGSTVLTFPSVSIDIEGASYQLWPDYTFDLSELDGWFAGLMAVVRLATSAVVVGAVIAYLQHVYKDVIG